MNIKKELFEQIGMHLQTHLSHLPPAVNLPNLAWFDKQMGQFTRPELFESVPLPCVLMEYGRFTWQTVGKGQQRGTGTIRFYIYFKSEGSSFNGAPDADLALKFYDFTQQLHLCLQGFSISGVTPLDRISDQEDNDQDMVVTTFIDYTTTLLDKTTDCTDLMPLVNPAIKVERVKHATKPASQAIQSDFLL